MEMPFGWIAIHWQDGVLTGVDLEPEAPVVGAADLPPALGEQLAVYLRDGLSPFGLPIERHGTPFQRRVWQALQAIPAGHTRTYGELAEVLGTSARAVGGACRANPCPIVVPCHRVVAKRGLGGFAGDTSGRKVAIKRWLLRHEGVELGGESSRNGTRVKAHGVDRNSPVEIACPAGVVITDHSTVRSGSSKGRGQHEPCRLRRIGPPLLASPAGLRSLGDVGRGQR